jgi:hypothetical protein
MVHNGLVMAVFEQTDEIREGPVGGATLTAEPKQDVAPLDAPVVIEEVSTAPPRALATEAALVMRVQLHRFQRTTAIIGMLFLIAGLAVWRFKPHSDDRLALILLVCAMFLAILHHYSLEETRAGRRP